MNTSSIPDASDIEIRTTYAPGSHCPTSTLAPRDGDDVYAVEGDLKSFGLSITHRKAYERHGVLVTDMVTGRFGRTHEQIVREVAESMVTGAVQLGLAA